MLFIDFFLLVFYLREHIISLAFENKANYTRDLIQQFKTKVFSFLDNLEKFVLKYEKELRIKLSCQKSLQGKKNEVLPDKRTAMKRETETYRRNQKTHFKSRFQNVETEKDQRFFSRIRFFSDVSYISKKKSSNQNLFCKSLFLDEKSILLQVCFVAPDLIYSLWVNQESGRRIKMKSFDQNSHSKSPLKRK